MCQRLLWMLIYCLTTLVSLTMIKVVCLESHTLLVDETVTPVISPACRVPHAVKPKVKAQLEKLTEREIRAPVEEPTSWCSRMVVATKKSGRLRICINPRPLNKALQREHYPLPVMEDILPKLSNARVF